MQRLKTLTTDHSDAGLQAAMLKSLSALASACPLNISFYRKLLRVISFADNPPGRVKKCGSRRKKQDKEILRLMHVMELFGEDR